MSKTRNFSKPISRKLALTYRTNYYGSDLALGIMVDSDDLTLEGFTFRAQDIWKLINSNSDISQIAFYLGFDDQTTNDNTADWCLIAYGMTGKGEEKNLKLLEDDNSTIIPNLDSIPARNINIGETHTDYYKELREYYKNSYDFRISMPAGSKYGNILEGFYFNKDHIIEIIRTNHSGKFPDTLKFYLGMDIKAVFGDEKLVNWSLIAYGVTDNLLLDYVDETMYPDADPSIYDHADPIPPPPYSSRLKNKDI